ncbi:MAG: hypothetical protein C0501_00395 [Isosphaera sp.]|nr:hypothetical protein [Isosphaera sp.]
MAQNPPPHSDDTPTKGSGPLYEFVDEAHEVTEEEQNRPRYGRPVRPVTGREFRVELQALRVPAGWSVGWNTLFEVDPTPGAVAAGFFGGSSLYQATHGGRRLTIDVEWRPEDDPGGHYRLRVLYSPWGRTGRGRRVDSGELIPAWDEPYHEFTTASRSELVRELEEWLRRCTGLVVEPN